MLQSIVLLDFLEQGDPPACGIMTSMMTRSEPCPCFLDAFEGVARATASYPSVLSTWRGKSACRARRPRKGSFSSHGTRSPHIRSPLCPGGSRSPPDTRPQDHLLDRAAELASSGSTSRVWCAMTIRSPCGRGELQDFHVGMPSQTSMLYLSYPSFSDHVLLDRLRASLSRCSMVVWPAAASGPLR